MLKKLYSLLFLLIHLTVWGQNYEKQYRIITNKKVVHYADSMVETYVLDKGKKINKKLDKQYYWYAMNDIKATYGDFEGMLLHGQYIKYYGNKNLLEKGSFVKGLKHGQWIRWNMKGDIVSIVKWKKGFKSGKAISYKNDSTFITTQYRKNIKVKEDCFIHGKKVKNKKVKDSVQNSKDKIKQEKPLKSNKKNKNIKIYKFRLFTPGGQQAYNILEYNLT